MRPVTHICFFLLFAFLVNSGCFRGPSKKSLLQQTIPEEILGLWTLLALNGEKPNCEISIRFSERGVLKTTFVNVFEGYYQFRGDGKLDIQSGIHPKIFYPGYEDCNIGTVELGWVLNNSFFSYSFKQDTLKLEVENHAVAIFSRR